MCKIIKIAFKTQVFRKRNWGGGSAEFFSLRGGSLSHTLKTPGLDYCLENLGNNSRFCFVSTIQYVNILTCSKLILLILCQTPIIKHSIVIIENWPILALLKKTD